MDLVDLLLNEFESCTTNNGFFSEYFGVTRSCHQGCPLAPLLYLVCGEVMAQKIRENQQIRGITVYDLKQVISQFADDTQLFITNTIKELREVVKTLTQIETNISLSINYAAAHHHRT